jgi:hypothetical protein
MADKPMSEVVLESARKHPRQLVEISLMAWEGVVLPGLMKEFARDDSLRERIRAELRRPCRKRVPATKDLCGLNKGHIGACSPFEGVVTVNIERIWEILDGPEGGV